MKYFNRLLGAFISVGFMGSAGLMAQEKKAVDDASSGYVTPRPTMEDMMMYLNQRLRKLHDHLDSKKLDVGVQELGSTRAASLKAWLLQEDLKDIKGQLVKMAELYNKEKHDEAFKLARKIDKDLDQLAQKLDANTDVGRIEYSTPLSSAASGKAIRGVDRALSPAANSNKIQDSKKRQLEDREAQDLTK